MNWKPLLEGRKNPHITHFFSPGGFKLSFKKVFALLKSPPTSPNLSVFISKGEFNVT
jgi:hypothetical protein